MNRMNPEIKARWVAALRSGEYKQGTGALRNARDEFCCLGLLCNLHAIAHPEVAAEQKFTTTYIGHGIMPPKVVMEWAGLDDDTTVVIDTYREPLAIHNDGNGCPRRSFSEIADAIESQL